MLGAGGFATKIATMADLARAPKGIRTWPTWLALAVAWTLARWPWRLQQAAGRAFGALLYALMPWRRRVAATNLALCFPELDAGARQRLLRANFAALGVSFFEFLRAWWGRSTPMTEAVQIGGLEHLLQAKADGKGVILISAHFTTLELCGRMLSERVRLAGMYRPHDSAALEWAVRRGRARYTDAMFTREELRPALRHLKAGGALWFAPDQETRRGESVFVPFFGRPARSLTSTHQLARLSGAKVLGFFHQRLPDGRYRLEITPPLDDFPSRDAETDTARVMALLEGFIRRCPEQYLWLHQRFKSQPDGERFDYRAAAPD